MPCWYGWLGSWGSGLILIRLVVLMGMFMLVVMCWVFCGLCLILCLI